MQRVERNRGRLEARCLIRFDATAEAVCFPGVEQAARLTRFVDRRDSKQERVEIEWLISSRGHARLGTEAMLAADRNYWGIENGLHLRLDVTAGEDRSRVRHPVNALNLAMMENFVTLEIPAGAQIQSPIHVVHLSRHASGSQAQMAYPAFFVYAGSGSSVTLVEAFSGSDENAYGVVSSTGIVIREGATVDHVRIQREGGKAFHFGLLAVRQERKSRYTGFSLAFGGAIARTDVVIKIDGDECETMLDGLYMTAKEQLIDHHTFIEHLHPNCSSREIFKGIVAGKSRAVFNGKIYVHREAQGTDSKQTNKNLLLSDEATVDTKPQLEIFADDVKCTHGATVGGLDAAALFYLKSRAIDEEAARDLLTLGFAGEVTSFIHNETIRHFVDTFIIAQLRATVTHTALPEIVH